MTEHPVKVVRWKNGTVKLECTALGCWWDRTIPPDADDDLRREAYEDARAHERENQA